MSKNAQEFINKACEDKQLRKQIMDCCQKKECGCIEKLAEACGCPCSYEELCECFKQNCCCCQEKLSDKELAQVCSGKCNNC